MGRKEESKEVRRPKIISIVNNKGGVAKTTSTINIASALGKLGKRVLMIDLDPQASLSVNFGLDPLEQAYNISTVLTEGVDLDEVICPTYIENLDLIISNIELSKAEFVLISKISRENLLKKKIDDYIAKHPGAYDFIIIDNSPSLGILTINSLMASDYVISPTDATYFSLKGLEILVSTIDEIKQWNSNLEFLGVLITMYDGRIKHHKDVLEALRDKYPVFQDIVKRSIKFSDSCLAMSSIFEYAGDNFEGSKAYLNVAKEIIKHGEEEN